MTRILVRPVPTRAALMLEQAGVHPLLARLFAARGIERETDIDTDIKQMLPPERMKGIDEAAGLLADAVIADQRLLIVADYDCDGATACALGLRALSWFGARVDYIVPDRITLGYGLSPEVVTLAAARTPDLLITVDNGIASVDGVAAAKALGMRVIVTDHHLPGDTLPAADAIVNPNQPGCPFPSKALAGVGVMFYVMLATRAELRRRDWFASAAFAARGRPCPASGPNLAALLDLVALGTVADVVPLDRNNRLLVAQGLARLREGRLSAGIKALCRVAGRDWRRASTFDLGFALGPRINAAGRLADMALGIECLTTDDESRALNIAQQLDAINRERRSIEADMQEGAEIQLDAETAAQRASLTLFDPGWHAGVIGILAGRLRERHHRPTFVFARGLNGELKGSGRSIPGLHLRDALDLIAKRHAGLLLRFGGHAAAAGVTIMESALPIFEAAFEATCRALLSPAELTRTLETDGALEAGYCSVDTAQRLRDSVWGQGFPAPVFSDVFDVERQRLLKDRHLKLTLRKGKTRLDAIRFNFVDSGASAVPERIRVAFRLDINEWNGSADVQLMIEHIEAA